MGSNCTTHITLLFVKVSRAQRDVQAPGSDLIKRYLLSLFSIFFEFLYCNNSIQLIEIRN